VGVSGRERASATEQDAEPEVGLEIVLDVEIRIVRDEEQAVDEASPDAETAEGERGVQTEDGTYDQRAWAIRLAPTGRDAAHGESKRGRDQRRRVTSARVAREGQGPGQLAQQSPRSLGVRPEGAKPRQTYESAEGLIPMPGDRSSERGRRARVSDQTQAAAQLPAQAAAHLERRLHVVRGGRRGMKRDRRQERSRQREGQEERDACGRS